MAHVTLLEVATAHCDVTWGANMTDVCRLTFTESWIKEKRERMVFLLETLKKYILGPLKGPVFCLPPVCVLRLTSPRHFDKHSLPVEWCFIAASHLTTMSC